MREFYANAYEHENFRAFVRGKRVAFDRTTINQHYFWPNIDDDGYNTYLSKELDWEEVITALCKPGTQWKLSGKEALSFPSSAMTRELKVWHYFIRAKLMQVTHFSDVVKDQAELLYEIKTKKSIDIGSVIEQSILQHVKMPNAGLYCPSLIIVLCYKAGVLYDANEELLHPKHVLDNNTFLSIKCWEDNLEPGPSTSSSKLPRQAHAQNVPVTDRLAILESSFQDLSHRFD